MAGCLPQCRPHVSTERHRMSYEDLERYHSSQGDSNRESTKENELLNEKTNVWLRNRLQLSAQSSCGLEIRTNISSVVRSHHHRRFQPRCQLSHAIPLP